VLISYAISAGGWIICMELYPGFALYRGLYEFGQSSVTGRGMQWQDLSDADSDNGMIVVLIIMSVEWVVLMFVAYYIDQVNSTGNGKSLCFFLKGFRKQPASLKNLSIQRQGSKASAQMEKADVIQEVRSSGMIYKTPRTWDSYGFYLRTK
jgi:hypothetical protein